jgi:hypothetical protein
VAKPSLGRMKKIKTKSKLASSLESTTQTKSYLICWITVIHLSFKKYSDWFYYKTTRSAAVFVLLPVHSSYSPLSIDVISSVELNYLILGGKNSFVGIRMASNGLGIDGNRIQNEVNENHYKTKSSHAQPERGLMV